MHVRISGVEIELRCQVAGVSHLYRDVLSSIMRVLSRDQVSCLFIRAYVQEAYVTDDVRNTTPAGAIPPGTVMRRPSILISMPVTRFNNPKHPALWMRTC